MNVPGMGEIGKEKGVSGLLQGRDGGRGIKRVK